jgi:aspartate/methionine/tyrosine aminotransferase
MSSLELPTCCSERRASSSPRDAATASAGEGFFRISLTVPDARLEEAMERVRGALDS